MARSLRKLLGYLLPYWAANDEADGALAWSLAAMIDIDLERMRSGLEARFPSRAGASALAQAGRDRLILRGRDETDAHYAARLKAWRYPRGHRVRGSVFALLEQISAYFGGGFELYGIDRNGNKRVRSAGDAESYSYGNAWTWDGGAAAQWARQWIVIDGSSLFRAQYDWGDASLWGGALGTSGYCIGMRDASAEDWRAVVGLTEGQHRWLPAGTQGEWIVVSMDGSTPVPDATWEDWSVTTAGVRVAARDADMRYIALRAELLDYTPVDDDFVTTFHDVEGSSMTGDDTSFPATITLPDGSTYAGDDTSWPTTITLVDDGSRPA
jgi:hypothetical protein